MWFCKHLKYCGVDNDLSRAIVSLEEDNSDLEESAGKKYAKRGVSIASEYYKDTPDRLRITGMSLSQNGPVLRTARSGSRNFAESGSRL